MKLAAAIAAVLVTALVAVTPVNAQTPPSPLPSCGMGYTYTSYTNPQTQEVSTGCWSIQYLASQLPVSTWARLAIDLRWEDKFGRDVSSRRTSKFVHLEYSVLDDADNQVLSGRLALSPRDTTIKLGGLWAHGWKVRVCWVDSDLKAKRLTPVSLGSHGQVGTGSGCSFERIISSGGGVHLIFAVVRER